MQRTLRFGCSHWVLPVDEAASVGSCVMKRSPQVQQFPLRLRVARGIVLVAALCFLGVTQIAWSDTPEGNSPPAGECENAQTTAAMRECENSRYQRADEKMNAAYRDLMSRLDAPGKAKLRRAQQAWIKFRDAEAAFRADAARGGTLAPLIRTSVLADMTESRGEQLSKQAQQMKK